MDPVEPGTGHPFKIVILDPGKGMASGIGSDSLGLGKTMSNIFEKKHQVIGFHDNGIGILEKNGFHARDIPVHGGIKGDPVLCFKAFVKVIDNFLVHFSTGVNNLPDLSHIGMDNIYILDNIFNRSQGKILALINPAKGTQIPGAVPG
jgi:hypothetical protein